jgi:hypothetical protein
VVQHSGAKLGKRYPLIEPINVIGRSPGIQIKINEASLSRQHARLVLIGDNVVVEDMGSSNGTFVNDVKTDGQAPLKDGDTIRLGTVLLKFFAHDNVDSVMNDNIYRSLAQKTLQKTASLDGNDDIRVKAGMAKVQMAQKDLPGALAYLEGKEFSREMVSFLNMRAIMSIRQQKFDEGIEFYGYALHGSGSDNQLKAKLLFNMGLGFVRTGNLERASACLSESCTLGGPKFQRASGPLKKVALVMKNREKSQAGL